MAVVILFIHSFIKSELHDSVEENVTLRQQCERGVLCVTMSVWLHLYVNYFSTGSQRVNNAMNNWHLISVDSAKKNIPAIAYLNLAVAAFLHERLLLSRIT